ncbi:sodium/proline symporter PutP [Corynebacterium sp. 320]|uniref:Sodium/proline symporter n=1 Tax=Corynebacterium zhongnanshanii TaxID=2768834 RepID=A0ABQ6VFK8_9CORY|nr:MULTISPECIES: sodium/proline symporter PutP [Corynebacterium]KAB1503954.1 sodium/proline symporter PutP [Corynebacterium sp. 320]KAB1552947.1 sodium/proline symporter PutP [Corynebacterium sp. 321]KAB1553833.1 sodium/proline symporter PutP [Corynebacterium sp. 319]KAB3523196.1 sodium/proline symporter PutP [Corynebacterium zhongnanshanii]KAB3528090.1 sodium/proline symporter PutP [Corynebacterium sp. 250]
MTEQTWFVIAMVIYLGAMLLIGLYGYKNTDEYEDYMLGGRTLHPFVAALSAGASDMSGWLLMGLPGALYMSGYGELWMAIGLLVGAAVNWKITAPRLRAYTEVANNSITVPSFLENRFNDRTHILRVASGLIILLFFTFYVSSGMVAGGRYFESTFDGDYLTGMIIIAAVTVGYTFIGGFTAVSYTDMVQGLIMFLALIAVPIFALMAMDDPSQIWTYQTQHSYGANLIEANPNWFSMFAGVSGVVIISNLAWGLGYFGQPHIIVRFMALRKPSDARAGMAYGVGWMALCLVGAVTVATIGPAYFGMDPSISIVDKQNFETIFLDMGRILFHPLIAGLVLTAVLAAIMSTISSQLLVVASALIEDIYKGLINKQASDNALKNLSRIAVIAVALFAALIALNPDAGILALVSFAWAGFGSAFGPVIVGALYWRRLNAAGAGAGLVAGAVVAFLWGGLESFGIMDKPFGLYEMVPGVLANVIAMVVVTLITKAPDETVTSTFDKAVQVAKDPNYALPTTQQNPAEQPA